MGMWRKEVSDTSDSLNILLVAMLDETKSVGNINTQVREIQKKLKKINITLNLDDFKKSFETVFGDIERRTRDINGRRIKFQALDETINKIKGLSTELDNIFRDLQKIGNVKSVSNIFQEDGTIKSFTVQLENSLGKLKEVSSFKVESKLNNNTGELEYGLTRIGNRLTEVRDRTQSAGRAAQESAAQATGAMTRQEIEIDKLNTKLSEYKNQYAGLSQYDAGKVNTLSNEINRLATLNPAMTEYQVLLNSVRYRLETLTQATRGQVSEEERMARALTDKNITIDRLNTSLSTLSGNKYIDSAQLQRVQSMVGRLKEMQEGTTAFRNAAKEASYEVSKLTKQARNISTVTSVFRTLSSLFMIGTPVMATNRVLRDLVQTTNELNHAMADIRIVSGMSHSQVEKLKTGYTELGKSIGATTKEVMDSAVEFVRQGRSISETQELLNASIVGAKLSGTETAEMTEYLTAAVNGYNVAAEKAISVVDKLISVDNNSATSMAELSLAMSRTSKSAQMVGVDIDHLIGYIGTVSSVTRKSAETIGESFKSIFSRYSNIKLGKFVDDGVVASDVRKALGNIGIEIMASEQEFKSFSETIDELTGKWNTLSDAEKASAANAMAGLRQKENFLVLMDEIAMANELTAISMDSNGLAMDRYNLYLESTEGKLNQFRASIEGVYEKTLSSDFVNFFIESGIAAANFAESIGGLTPILLGLGGAFAVYKNVGGAKCCPTNIKYADADIVLVQSTSLGIRFQCAG